MHYTSTPTIISPTVDRITVEEGYKLFLDLKAEFPLHVAARVTAEYIEQQIAHYPPRGRCDVCGELWAFDEHGPCTREGDAPEHQWQVTTPAAVWSR